jgi:hypothetical protein
MTPSKSPAKSEATAQNLLRQSKELFAVAVEKDEDLLPDQDNLELVRDSHRYLETWLRENPQYTPKMVAELWAQETQDRDQLDMLVEAVQKVLAQMPSPA